MAAADTSGGFLQPSLPSPPPSSVAGSSVSGAVLPRPRKHALTPGSAKENAFINHVDQGINRISRKLAMANRYGEQDPKRDQSLRETGYESFRQVGRDIESLLGIVWVSGTPSLQISYLLTLALMVVNSMTSFPPAPRTLFGLLRKLDAAFAALLIGTDPETGEVLPGFVHGKGISATEKVRIKSLAERTRVAVVELMSRDELDKDKGLHEEEGSERGGETEEEGWYASAEEEEDVEMDMARVYDQTLVELGDTLGGPSIGIDMDG